MDALLLSLLVISGMLTFSFGLAWLISSIAIVVEEIKVEYRKGIDPKDLADIWLVLNDQIPIFTALEIIKQLPRICRAILQKWKEEGILRISFVISVFSALVMVTTNHLLWGS